MSVTVTRDDLISTFLDEWSETPVFTDNVRGATPDDEPWIMAKIAPAFDEQPCLGRATGATWERQEGDCILMVHTPLNSAVDGLALAERARLVLSQQRFGQTITGVGSTIPAGVSTDNPQFYLNTVRISYRTDNLKA